MLPRMWGEPARSPGTDTQVCPNTTEILNELNLFDHTGFVLNLFHEI
jgi:hypothetical protein